MKKLVSFVLIVVLLVTASVLPAMCFSDDSVRYYRKNFTDKYVKPYDAADGYYFYFEQYHHYVDENDPDSEIDWVLVYAGDMNYTQGKVKQTVSNRIFLADESSSPFAFKYAVYDVKLNEFYPISDALFEKYDGLEEAFLKEEVGVAGLKIGDIDQDKKLTVLDATAIQRANAWLEDYKAEDDLSAYADLGGDLKYVSDFDRDGARSVMDATGIQLYLVEHPEIDNEDPSEMM
ncbi:MAG: hypothetical protein IKB73_07230 [Ruminococcus sp.]|nr:hypothetical protein [Ruminococcus sp.]